MEFRQGRFTIEAAPSEYDGYTDGRHWNGWAMPYFEKAEAEHIFEGWPEGSVQYDEAQDAFIVRVPGMPDDDDPELYDGFDIEVGETKHVYGIGAGCWTWDEVEDDTRS